MFRTLFYVVTLTLTPVSAFGHLEKCVGSSLAIREGTQSCWAAYRLEESRKICIPRSLWIQWLSAPSPHRLCGTWTGTWKAYSPPENSLHSKQKKKVAFQFQVERLPQESPANGMVLKIENFRERFSNWIRPSDPWGVFRKLFLNEKSPSSPQDLFRRVGFVHLLTASGIHLYALSQIWTLTLGYLFEALGMPIQIGLPFKRVLVFASWSLSWILCGARPGMLRPWALVLLQSSARTLGFRWFPFSPLLMALFLDLLAIGVKSESLNSGRIYYALAVGGGVLATSLRGNRHWNLAASSWVFAALWEAWEDGWIAVATPLISLASIPLFALGIYPGLLLGFGAHLLGLSEVSDGIRNAISRLTHFFLAQMVSGCTFVPTLWIVSRHALLSAALLAGIFLLLRLKRKSLISLATLLLVAHLHLEPKHNTQVEALDVGQGDAALIQGSSVGLIDVGSERALSSDHWLRLFSQRRISRIHWVALTHLDEDHAGGLLRLAKLIPIDCVATSNAELESPRGLILAKRLALNSIRIQNWQSSCIPFPVYDPPEDHSKKRNKAMSAVLIPGYFLSAGDADREDEIRIAKWATSFGKTIPVLKVSHHGSKTSSDPRFIKLIRPQEAWISSGAENRYGHPSLETLKRFDDFKIQIRRTDREGSLRNSD